ncbi:MAG: peptidase domain-containing ABC transporter [Cytophagales bacterium]|nr:peptidase domain-containing ABC transporter [Cytophagales bacterium]
MTRPKKPFPILRQTGMMECGTTSLAMVFKFYGYYDIKRFLAEYAEVNKEGIDLYTLAQIAQSFGFEADGYQMGYEHIAQVSLPFIAHFDGNHFVVVYKATEQKVWVADPANGKRVYSKKEFEEKWNGIGLVLEPTPDIFKHNELTELVEAQRAKEKSLAKRFYLASLEASKKNLVYVLIGSLFIMAGELTIPIFTQTIIDKVLVNKDIKMLYVILFGIASLTVANILLMHGRDLILTQFRINFERSFFSKFFLHFVRLKLSYFDRFKREDLINRFQENLKLREIITPATLGSILDFFFSIFLILILINYNALLGYSTAIFFVLFILLTSLMNPKLMRLDEQAFQESMKSMGMFLDTLLGVQATRLLGIEYLKYQKWRNQYTKSLNREIKITRTYLNYTMMIMSIWFAGQVFVYWYGAYLIFDGSLSIGSYVAFTAIFMRLFMTVARTVNLQFMFVRLRLSYNKLNDVLSQPEIDLKEGGVQLPAAPIAIKINDLTFKYLKNHQNNTLESLNLEITPGSFVGVVGRNGSGKSTLIKLISRLYDEYTGEIMLSGSDITTISEASLRKRMGVIPQDVFVFDGSIRENILLGNPQATEEQLLDAIEKADFMDYVRSQYLGLNTHIGENGTKLSGGEQLKLAFARLFVSSPELIILDEASSALDVETEKKIMKNVHEQFGGKTIISIAHRLYTLKNCDQILVIDKGQLAEQGDHASLMKQEGLYAQFISNYVSF